MLDGSKIKVYRMSGAGNLFSALDGRTLNIPDSELPELAKALCNKSEFNDFQAEGMFIIYPGELHYDYNVKFYNPDGSTGMMCGNAGRCSITLAKEIGLINKSNGSKVQFTMSGAIYSGIIDKEPTIYFPPPLSYKPSVKVEVGKYKFDGEYYNVGSDHFVVELDFIKTREEFNKFDVAKYGNLIRNHRAFEPSGVNVNFMYFYGYNVFLRTYERGVEAETGACGTGAISTALLFYHWSQKESKNISLTPTSGYPLHIKIIDDYGGIKKIGLKGHTEILKILDIELPEKI